MDRAAQQGTALQDFIPACVIVCPEGHNRSNVQRAFRKASLVTRVVRMTLGASLFPGGRLFYV
jgi:hypothetical protein